MSRSLKCDACGKHAGSDTKNWVSDEFRNVFCTNACYSGKLGSSTACVEVVDFFNVIKDKSVPRRILYTDANTQHVLYVLQNGEKLSATPEKHEGSTETILLIEGEGTVTIIREEDEKPVSYEVILSPDVIVEGEKAKTLVFIPCNVLHQVENSGGRPLTLYVTYSPPVLKVD